MLPRKPWPIQWTQNAWEDLDGIADYLLAEKVDVEIAKDFLKRLFKAPKHLVAFPSAGKPGRASNTREWRVANTSYALIYAIRDDGVHILRVMHDSRRFPVR